AGELVERLARLPRLGLRRRHGIVDQCACGHGAAPLPTPLSEFCSGRLYHLFPALELGCDEARERLGRAADDFRAITQHPFTEIRAVDVRDDERAQLVDDSPGRAARRQNTE